MIIDIHSLFQMGMSRVLPRIVPFPPGEVLNLGAGRKVLPIEATPLDLPEWNAWHVIPRDDGTVAGVLAFHFLEHLAPVLVIKTISEIDRVLMSGGSALIVVPYYSSQMQAQNLDHRSAFCEETWRNLLTDETYAREYERAGNLRVGLNLVCGIVERNLCLMTQLVKD